MNAGGLLLLPSPRKAGWSGRWVKAGAVSERMEPGLGREG